MNRLARIIELLDAAVKAGIGEFTTRAFGYGEQIQPDSKTAGQRQQTKIVLSNNGQDKYDLTLTDNEDIIWYHRLASGDSIQYEQSDSDGLGDSRQITETLTMRLIVWGDVRKTGYNNYQLADVFNRLINIRFAQAQLQAMNLKNMVIDIQNANVNSSEVLSQEFSGIENRLGVERKFIAITYLLQMKYDTECNVFDPCDPDIDCVTPTP